MIRKYCDLCDNELKDDDRVFTLEVGEITQEKYAPHYKDLRIDGTYVTPTQYHGMVCIGCVNDVVKVIHGKSKNV